ncbi:organic hydroperoxide resistance protein [Entomoplasma ellychniae]|uniref:Organic hydroperoxide resistance protein n=2 Tax=Entomoplasmataceae TaxID=33925 RepID=A0A2S5RGP7_9MOLU|nr:MULTISPECIES: organic hydroperoxide resistance protein [Entomoplasmataceae]PPE04522.1 organic hydroperoxide resistance protein [Entomoplasma ellychniae]PPE06295.1 organic hydroperoxide resistance protein [Mesoplasma corruscae]
MSKIYEAEIKNTGGRTGEVSSPDNKFNLKVSSPTLNVEGTTNPEQLFAAGYSACFNGALQAVMNKNNSVFPSNVTAKVSLHHNGDLNFNLSVEIIVEIVGIDQEIGERLMHEADLVCPYSKALRNNVEVKLQLK